MPILKPFINRFIALLGILFLGLSLSAWAAPDSNHVYVLNIEDEIADPAWHDTKNAFKQAKAVGASHMIINLNTYGGLVLIADSMRTSILRSEIPVYVLINNNAASAGALISIACDKIYMMPGSTIGAATVVTEDGAPAIDKYQSYMRSKMRATAEEKNRDPNIAEAMVDQDIEIEGVIEKGKLLTFTVSEAIANGFCDGEAEDIDAVIALNNLQEAKITTYTPTTVDKITKWLIHPTIHGILIMIIIGGIYFELQSPGIGFPIAASGIAAILFFAPLYLNGLAENWEIVLFVIGLLLLIAEVFFIPGTGLAGILGSVLVITGLTLSMLNNVKFNFEFVEFDNVVNALAVVILASVGLAVLVLTLLPRLATTGKLSRLVLVSEQTSNAGYVGVDTGLEDLLNATGIATTDLRPGGQVKVNGSHYDAIAERGFIEKNSEIKVVGTDSAQITVRKI
jgi:membrane-bound serine protease (ClpP class)